MTKRIRARIKGEQDLEYSSRLDMSLPFQIGSDRSRSNFFVLNRAGSEVTNEIIASHVKFFKGKTEVHQKLESNNFLKSRIIPVAGVKTLEPGEE